MPRAVCGRVHRTSLPPPTTKPSFQCITQYTLPGRETTPPLHTMAPAFMVELQSMLSWFPLVVVVDGGSKQAVHVVVWGGTANECLRSVSKRTNKLEPNPLQLYPQTLTFRTLDHRMVSPPYRHRLPPSPPPSTNRRALLSSGRGLIGVSHGYCVPKAGTVWERTGPASCGLSAFKGTQTLKCTPTH